MGRAASWVCLTILVSILLPLAAKPAAGAPVQAAVLRVPLDFSTIQAAIDAAQAGDEVRILMTDVGTEPEYFGEHLTITKTLTLSGGWSADFSAVIGHTYLVPNADLGKGRGITIATTAPITVTIRGLIVVGGEATGQGCGSMEMGTRLAYPAPSSSAGGVVDNGAVAAPGLGHGAASAAGGGGAGLAAWMARLHGLAAEGRYPGGLPSLEEVQTNVARLAGVQQLLQSRQGAETDTASAASLARPEEYAATTSGPDCGGGLFAEGADLVIEASEFRSNVAAATGDGIGGGLFATGGSLLVENSTFANNTAAATGYGEGGGLVVNSIPPGGAVTLRQLTVYRNMAAGLRGMGGGISLDGFIAGGMAPMVTIEASTFRENIAGRGSGAEGISSYGGGLYLRDAPGAAILDNEFLANTAAGGGIEGYGGGLHLSHARGAVVAGNSFKSNIANAQSTYQYKPGTPPRGYGGGASIVNSQGAQVTENLFKENTAALQVAGEGGGLAALSNSGATFSGNRFERNVATFQPALHYLPSDYETSYGGGLQLSGGQDVTVTFSIFSANYGVFQAGFLDQEYALGGGLGLYQTNGALVANNIFTANVACGDCEAYGGGLAIFGAFGGHTQPAAITVTANSLLDNAASLGGHGVGGGIYLYNLNNTLVQGNRVEGNQASATGGGSGGGIGLNPYFRNAAQVACQDVLIDGNIVRRNRATVDGGGILAWGPDQTVVANNVVADNWSPSGGGVAYYGTAPEVDAPEGLLVNNTVVGNGSQGILLGKWLMSTVNVTNNIVVSQTVGVAAYDGSHVDLSYTLWHGNGVDVPAGITQTHGVSAPPGFVSAEMGDYRLDVLSAARDAGDPAGVPPAPAQDLDGTPRPIGVRVDLGAYEWVGGAAYLPLVVGEGEK